MAIVSSHTLDAVHGTHAGGIRVTLSKVSMDASRSVVFQTQTDQGGRLLEELPEDAIDTASQYELVFETGAYFAALPDGDIVRQIVSDVVLRFSMPVPSAKYHLPIIISPNGYSVWWSR